MKYNHYDNQDLLKFATDRGIPIPYCSKLRTQSSKRGLVRTLEEADQNRTFRFLDLPPELRNMVYRELLVIEKPTPISSEPKCYPQILRTSKVIHQEAAGILTGDNLIVVRVCPSRVFVHGIECGTYEPQIDANTQKTGQKRSKNLIWPDLLRRARMIRVVIVDINSASAGPLAPPNCGTIHNILFSLCSFLQQNMSLKSFELDLTRIAAAYLLFHGPVKLQEQIRLTLYPLRMLQDVVTTRIEGIDFLSFSQPPEPSLSAVKVAMDIASGSVFTVTRQLQAILRTETILIAVEKSLTTATRPLGPPTEAFRFASDFVSLGFAGYGFLAFLGSVARTREALSLFLELVRDYCDRVSLEWAPDEIKKQVNAVLILGVELRRAEGRMVAA